MLLCFNSTLPSALPALFPVRVRYGALAVAFNVSVALFGGTTPLIAEGLVAVTGSKLVPAFLLVAAGLVGAVAVYFARETAGRPLPGAEPSAASPEEAKQVEEELSRNEESEQ